MNIQQQLYTNNTTYPPDFPPPPKNNMKTLIFDLDDTLIHSSLSPPNSYVESFKSGNPPIYISERPGLDNLLQKYSKLFDIFIFTSGERLYADPIIRIIWPFLDEQHKLFRNSCTFENFEVHKDLKAFNRPENEIILVEDNVLSKKYFPENTIIVPKWFGEPNDKILISWLPDILDDCVKSHDVRKVIKHIDD